MIETGKKDRRTGEDIKKPLCVADYNSCMGAIDKADMMLSSIGSIRKSQQTVLDETAGIGGIKAMVFGLCNREINSEAEQLSGMKRSST
ncbi:hypothetical protein J437_LFUL017966 [Ladona fulva]|uniref:Uncharacterized protein n=1 Tax=Ladona fulva TaxID=123851 RepID=A0A8K0KWD7_LADFU|nr:hypothetical protein J437_LFUL017966 [Ladona fulva]